MDETDFKEAAVHHQVMYSFKKYTLLVQQNVMKYFAHGKHILYKDSIIIIIITKLLGFSCNGNLKAAFLKLFSSGDHFYQSECSTDHPTLVCFESKLFEILNYSV
jgi:hypothetical protein